MKPKPRKLQPKDISLLESLGIVFSQALFIFYETDYKTMLFKQKNFAYFWTYYDELKIIIRTLSFSIYS